jgi:uncharacterized membrane protein YedE/YeeE
LPSLKTMPEPNIVGGLIGGALIGLSACLMLLLIGRLTGISGILGGIVVCTKPEELPWRSAFVGGLVVGAGIFRWLVGPLPLQMQAHGALLAVAGLLVGFGTRLGSGCTSGHGVCGLGRRAPRSCAATLVFIGVAIVTVYVTRHLVR